MLSYASRQERHKYGRVVELVDSLDSGSSVHCGRAGSSPASPTKETVERLSLFLPVDPCQKQDNSLVFLEKRRTREFFTYGRHCYLFSTITTCPRRPCRQPGNKLQFQKYMTINYFHETVEEKSIYSLLGSYVETYCVRRITRVPFSRSVV